MLGDKNDVTTQRLINEARTKLGKYFFSHLRILAFILVLVSPQPSFTQNQYEPKRFDVVVVGGTTGGIMAAVAAARRHHSVVLIERTSHVGGVAASGLGATDIETRGATGGLFLEFINRIRNYYVKNYGAESPQVKASRDGYHFEPSVAERVFVQLLAEHPQITVLLMRQFDALPENVKLESGRLTEIKVLNRERETTEIIQGQVFIDATYEGDLAAAAGAPYRVGREGYDELKEPMAGQLYKQWKGPIGSGSTGLGDNALQAYNYRLALTRDKNNLTPITKPGRYNRDEYFSLIEDLKQNLTPAPKDRPRPELEFSGIGRVVNMVELPNGKTDANNQHASFLSTDLPEENWPWPTASWKWRDRFAQRLKDYTLGLLWFCQNDPDLPEDFRDRAKEWGLAKDEYTDNDNFPRQVYVREGRRIIGQHLFTALDALPQAGRNGRPTIYANSITASHYSLDSHAVRKREPGRVNLEGFFSYPTRPYTVPYGVIVPTKVDGLLVPVAVSGTHVGFSTLRMEPCWMALGQAAGLAAGLSIEDSVPVRKVSIKKLQQELLKQKAVLMYFDDVSAADTAFEAVEYFGLRGLLPKWSARLNELVATSDTARWIAKAGVHRPAAYRQGVTTRGELLQLLYQKVTNRPSSRVGLTIRH
ncbi:MAG TPA: FAD-dependent oxidoreductase [Pyrinomonadaceae bacterium]